MIGDLVDAIETVSGHSSTTHVHDNAAAPTITCCRSKARSTGRAALTALQKVGYDGVLLLELAAGAGRDGDAGAGARRARPRWTRWSPSMTRPDDDDHVYIEDIAQHEGQSVTLKGWLHNRRSSGKIHFLIVRDGTGFIQAVMSKAAVGDEMFTTADHLAQEISLIVTGTVRADKRAPGGYEIDVKRFEVVGASHDYPITPKEHGVDYLLDRRHLWIRAQRQQAILRVRHEIIDAVPRLLRQPRLHPRRHADLHAGRVRGHDDAVPGAVLRGHDRVPDAERPALQRGERDGARQGLLLRPDVPRREVEDAPPPDRVLDGRAGDGLRRPRRRDGPGRGARRRRSSRACSTSGSAS